MSQQLLTPKYLTKEIAEQAVNLVLHAVMSEGSTLRSRLKRNQLHIAVLVPAMQDHLASAFPDWPDYPLKPVTLYEHSVGDPTTWLRCRFDKIARSKALQWWTGRNDDHAGVIPHLLFLGDTFYWGGVKRQGIVVTCSGVQPWFDRMIAGMIADALIALAHDAYENDEERMKGADYVS